MAAQKNSTSNTRLKVVTNRPRKRAPTAKELRAEVERLTALLQWRQRFGVILTSGALPFVGAGLGWLGTTYLFRAIEAPTLASCLLAALTVLMTATALRISLPHVRRGAQVALKLDEHESVALAIVADLSMVTAEIILHTGPDLVSTRICYGLMFFGLAGSIAFNIAGFLAPKPEKKSTAVGTRRASTAA